MKKAIATIINQKNEPMTIYYNGANKEITAENENTVEEAGYVAESLEDAQQAAANMWSGSEWEYEEI